MLIVGIPHKRVLGGSRNITHAARKGVDDVQRCAVELSGSVVLSRRALLTIRVHRPVDDPSALLVRTVDGAPVEVLIPRHFRFRLRLLDRRRRFLVDDIHNAGRIRPTEVQARRANRCKVRVPTRKRIGCGGISDNGVVLVLEGSFHFVVNVYIKVEISLCSSGRPVPCQAPVGVPYQHGIANLDGNGSFVDAEILRPRRLKRILHRHRIRMDRIYDGLQCDARLPCRPARRRSVLGAHKLFGNWVTH